MRTRQSPLSSSRSRLRRVVESVPAPHRRYAFPAAYAVGVAVFVLREVLLSDGIFVLGDLSYPGSRELFPGFQTWDPTSQSGVIVNHLVFDPWLAFFDPWLAQRLKLFLLFFLLPYLSFLGFRGVLERHFDRHVLPAALLGSLLYTFNPIVVMRSRHYFLLWFYAFLPLLFHYSVALSAAVRSDLADSSRSPLSLESHSRSRSEERDPPWVKIALVLFLMSASVRMPYYFLVPLFVVLGHLSRPYRRYLWLQTREWSKIFTVYLLLTAVWSLPILGRVLEGSPPTPSGSRYVLTEAVVELLSRNATIREVVFLQSFWQNDALSQIFGMDPSFGLYWTIAVGIVVVLAIHGAVLHARTNRAVLSLAALLVVSVFLAKGANPPFAGFYPWLIFESPLAPIGWQFRGANKWNLILMFCYAGLATFSFPWLFRIADVGRGWRASLATKSSIGLALLIVVATVGAPMASGHLSADREYVHPDETYKDLLATGPDQKVLAYPNEPSIGTPGRGAAPGQVYDYAVRSGADGERYLARANVGHVYATEPVPALGLEAGEARAVESPADVVSAHGSATYAFGFPALDERPTVYDSAGIGDGSRAALRRADVVSLDGRPPVPFFDDATVIAPFDHVTARDPARSWSRAATDDPLHGAWHPVLRRYGLENWQFDYGRGLVFAEGTTRVPEDRRRIDGETVRRWRFDDPDAVDAWREETPERQFDARQELSAGDDALAVSLHDSTGGWKTVDSPPIPVDANGTYRVRLGIRGEDVRDAHVKVAELDGDGKTLSIRRVAKVGDGSFDRRLVDVDYAVRNRSTEALRIEVWHGHRTSRPLPNRLWIDDVRVSNLTGIAEPVSATARTSVDEPGEYRLFVRHFESERGGEIAASLDGERRRVDTRGPADAFVWTDLGTHRLDAGEHELRLTNERGFNAVNLFVLVPAEDLERQERRFGELLEDKTVRHDLDAVADFALVRGATIESGSDGRRVSLGADGTARRQIDVARDGQYILQLEGDGAFHVSIAGTSHTVETAGGTATLDPIELERGTHALSVESVDQRVAERRFENGSVPGGASDGFVVERDRAGGDAALRVTAESGDVGWSWIHTDAVNVTPGNSYAFETRMKYRNVDSTHVLVLGYNATAESWQRLGAVPPSRDGTADWETHRRSIEAPEDVTRVKFVLNAGGALDEDEGNATTWFDDLVVTEAGDASLDAVRLSAPPGTDSVGSTALTAPSGDAATVERVERLSPTKYRVRVDADEPYLLSFAEAHDPLWVAEVDGPDGTERYESLPLQATTNGFWIDETGEHTVTIRYLPQAWLFRGAGVTAATLALCLGALLYRWRRRCGDDWVRRVDRRLRRWRGRGTTL